MTTPPPKTHGTGEYMSFLEQRVAELEAKVEAGYDLADLLDWAISCWNSEVKNRPRCNIYRPVLDQTWRKVIRYAGGDPKELLGCPVQIEVENQED